MVNNEIRLIILFAAKDGEALYSHQKQDWELTVAQIMNSILKSDSEGHSVMSNSLQLHGILQTRILDWVAFPISRGILLTQGSSSHIAGGFFIS